MDINPSRWRNPGPFDPERAAMATRYMQETGDHHTLIALRAGLHPDQLVGWLFAGMRRDGTDPERSWAIAFLQAEAEYSARCLEAINAATDKLPAVEEDDNGGMFQRSLLLKELDQRARHARWVLEHRFGAFWGTKQTVSTASEVVGLLIRADESERLERARKFLSSLPPSVKAQLQQIGFST